MKKIIARKRRRPEAGPAHLSDPPPAAAPGGDGRTYSQQAPRSIPAPDRTQRGRGLEMLRHRVRDSGLRNHSPFVFSVLRIVWNGIDILRPRKGRSYIHGLLFDIKGGVYTTEGMAFHIAPEQFPRSYRSRLYFDIYEAPERRLAHKWIKPDSAVLELGGCVGVVSCVINKLLTQPENHVVVEANPTLIDVLRDNRDANGCFFHIENCIVSRADTADFYIAGLMTANSKDSGNGQRITVATSTLKELEGRYGITFDTLVLDIEGGEFDFFIENEAELTQFNLIILEFHHEILDSDQLTLCASILERAGLLRADVCEQTEVWARLPVTRVE